MGHHDTAVRRGAYAVSGLLAAAAGAATGHLVAAVVAPAASPVLAIGSTVVDATPTPVKQWAVETLGTADKAVLLASVAVVTAALAAAIGLVSLRHRRLGTALVVLLAALAGAAALTRPAAGPEDALPAAATAAVGVVVLVGLIHLLGRAERQAPPPPERPESPLDHTAYALGTPGRVGRRDVVLAATGIAIASAGVGALGQRLIDGGASPSVALPAPRNHLPALPTGIGATAPQVSPLRTPTTDFYRVDTALVVPRVDPSTWRLTVDGEVDHPFTLSFRDLLAMPMVEKDITLNCVSNPVGGPYVGSTRWLGVPVRDLLRRAGLRDGVDQILSGSTDGMTISTPREALTDARDALVAVAMDGRPLPAEHGFPARLITPGLYGYVGATKWLTRLHATTYAAQQAYWTRRGWAQEGPVKTQTRIDTPQGLQRLTPGRVVIAGVAWSQDHGGIEKVEVRIDGGPWQAAALGPEVSPVYWRQWYLPWQATTAGRHEVTARATDGQGDLQTAHRADPFPSGASGYHSVVVTVT